MCVISIKTFVIHPGSTSTKVGVFEDEVLLFEETPRHPTGEIAQYASVIDQKDFRKNIILNFLQEKNCDPASLDVIVGRGGLLKPIPGGTYAVNDELLADLWAGVQGALRVMKGEEEAKVSRSPPLLKNRPRAYTAAGVVCMLGILGIFLQAAAGQILYLALHLESGSFPRPLPPAEEQAAFAAMAAGDTAARDRLIRHNLRLVAHVAKKYYASPDGQDDLISIGTIGLIKAVDSFDPARRVRFASYASQCIENEIRMHLRRVRREAGTVSLQEPLEGDSGMLTLADTLPDDVIMEDDCERRDAIVRLRALVADLPDRDRRLLVLRYGLDGTPPMTQQQVAARFGISRSYVSRLEKRALAMLSARWNA